MIDKYWQIASANWVVVAILGLLVLFFGMLVYLQMRKNNKFNFIDTLIDHSNGKASQNAVIIYAMAGVSIWYIVVKTTNPAAGNVGSDLVQILLVFLVYRGAKEGIEAWKVKPPAPPAAPSGDNVGVKQVLGDAGDAPRAAEAATDVGVRRGPLPSAIRTIKA